MRIERLFVALMLLAAVGCSTTSPDAGQQVVLIEKPYFFGHGGVDDTPVQTGRAFIAWTTDEVEVDMQPIQKHIVFDDLMSQDGVPLDFDAVIRFQITDSVGTVKRFRSVDSLYANNIEREVSNAVREAVKKHGMNETAINTVALQAIDDEVSKRILDYVKANDLPVKVMAFTVGRANPPDSIKNQRVETAAQQQRVLTEQQRKLAEDSRKASEVSRANADNAYRESMGFSKDEYLQLELYKRCAEHCTFIIGANNPLVIGRK